MIRFAPRVGQHYSAGFWKGLTLLVLGESHYGDADEDDATTTCHWLDGHIAGEVSPTWSKCEKLLAYCRPSPEPLNSVWDHVAFANFVQRSLPDRQSRGNVDWASGRAAFPELLRLLIPNVVLVLGRSTWCELPWEDWPFGEPKNNAELASGDNRSGVDQWAVTYPLPSGFYSLVGFIDHPASHGWRTTTWYPHVNRLLLAAEQLKQS